MQTVGAYLKKERAARRISLREVSDLTKISPVHIVCLEKDEYDKLPQGPYIKGYLTSYAQMLGIDVDEVIKRYQLRNREPAHELPSTMVDTEDKNKGIFMSSRKHRLLLTVAAFFLVVAASWMFFLREEDPVPTVTPPTLMIADTLQATDASPPNVIPPPTPDRFETAQSSPATFSAESPPSETPQIVDPESRQVTEPIVVTYESVNSIPDTGTEADGALEILLAVACTGVENRSPVGPEKTFPRTTPRVYIFNKLKCTQPPCVIRHVYYFKNRKTSEIELNIPAALWRTWSYKTISNEHMVGEWRVDIMSSIGEVLAQVPFTIKWSVPS